MIQDHPDKMRQQKQVLWTLSGVNLHLISRRFLAANLTNGENLSCL